MVYLCTSQQFYNLVFAPFSKLIRIWGAFITTDVLNMFFEASRQLDLLHSVINIKLHLH